jgi:hypothetical protein
LTGHCEDSSSDHQVAHRQLNEIETARELNYPQNADKVFSYFAAPVYLQVLHALMMPASSSRSVINRSLDGSFVIYLEGLVKIKQIASGALPSVYQLHVTLTTIDE